MANVLQEQGGHLTPGQRHLALQVLKAGKRQGATRRQDIVALITGLQESGLKNLPIAAENSGGWRQEKAEFFPDPTNVTHSATRFFKELKSVPHGSVGEEAQAVQKSAFPGAYQPHVKEAQTILRRLLPLLEGAKGGTNPVRGAGPQKAAGGAKGRLNTNSSQYKLAALDFIKSYKDNPEQALFNFIQAKHELSAPTPLTNSAQAGFMGIKNPRAAERGPVNGSNAGLVRWAEMVEGTNEGSARQERWAKAAGIGPGTAWCSAFVAYGLRKQGYSLPSDPAYSGSWLNWKQGKKINYKNARPGDLLIFDWGDGGITDHVGIYIGHGQFIGGNNSANSTGRSSVPVGNIVGVVRPTKR